MTFTGYYYKNQLMKYYLFPLILICSNTFASMQNTPELKSCIEQPAVYASRSAELQEIYNADQADRTGSINSIDWSKVSPRDLARRVRVG